MGTMASQISSLANVYSTVHSGVDQRKHQSPASLVFVWGIYQWLVNSSHKWPVTRKMFPFDNVMMQSINMWWCSKIREVKNFKWSFWILRAFSEFFEMRENVPVSILMLQAEMSDNIEVPKYYFPWWRHQMETFSALLAICGQWREALMFSLICAWMNGWVNNREAGDLRSYRAHYDVTVMTVTILLCYCNTSEVCISKLQQIKCIKTMFINLVNSHSTYWKLDNHWRIVLLISHVLCLWLQKIISYNNHYPTAGSNMLILNKELSCSKSHIDLISI